jgi:phage-related protein
MPADLDGKIIAESRKLGSSSSWLWLLAVTINGVAETIRLVNNTENIEYFGYTYTRCNFELGPWQYTESGELPTRELKITNIDLVNYLLPYVEDYDGIIGAQVITVPVNSNHLDVDMSAKAMDFMVLAGSSSEQWIVFTLGAPNPLIQWIQRNKYYADYCPFVSLFRGAECGYAGEETVCNGLLSQCRQYGNQARFGGEPGLRSKTVRFTW